MEPMQKSSVKAPRKRTSADTKAKQSVTANKKSRIPRSQPSLMNFITDKNVRTVIKKGSASKSLSQSISTSIPNCEMYLLILGTKIDMQSIHPIIIRTAAFDSLSKQFIKCRIDNSPYVGRVISASKSLQKLEETVESATAKFAIGWKKNLIKTDQIIFSCTANVNFTEVSESDPRVQFLKDILICASNNGASTSTSSLPPDVTDSHLNGDDEYDLNDNGGFAYSDAILPDKIHELNAKQTTSSFDQLEDEFMYSNDPSENPSIHENGLVHDVSSGSDDEKNSSNCTGKRRRKRHNTDVSLLIKLREENRQKIEDANVEIVNLINMLDEIVPTLAIANPTTPVLKHIYALIKAINIKLNSSNDKAVREKIIPLKRKVKVKKDTLKDEVEIEGVISCKGPEYDYATKADEPRLIISRLIRSCIPDELKDGCTVNDDANESNFLYRIGDSTLDHDKRLANGREKIEILIEHAHALKDLDCMTYQSYRECRNQIDKALYDFERNKHKRLTSTPIMVKSSQKLKLCDDTIQEDNDNQVQYLFNSMMNST